MRAETITPHTRDVLILAALSRMSGLGNRVLWQLLQATGGPQALWEASETFLRTQLPPAKCTAFLRQREAEPPADWLELYERCGISIVPYTDPRYPERLGQIYSPPLLLYVKGSLESLQERTLGVVGTRKMTEYGRQVTEKVVSELLPAGCCIVSGLAAGIDTAAHWAALNHGLPTAAVFGCGLDIIFPRLNQRLSEEIVAAGGALISEYPLGTPGSKYTFPERNRIVAGLSDGVLVVEGDIRSGALITARLALEEGRSVYAVPGNIFSPGSQGPHYLIRNGAAPVGSGIEIIEDLHWQAGDGKQQRLFEAGAGTDGTAGASEILSDAERQLLERIPYDPVSLERLREITGLSSAELNERLTLLELEDVIVLLPGAHVCRK